MILSSFSYKTTGWELVDMTSIQLTNLLVGKNASGKTRSIRALRNLVSFLLAKPLVFGDRSFKAALSFSEVKNPDWSMKYSLEIVSGVVISEQFLVCKRPLIKRTQSKTIFYGETINPPKDKLTIQVRRDKEAYPDVEFFMDWIENVVTISCSDINPYTIVNGPIRYINPITFSDLVNALNTEEKKSVLKNAKQLGYNILDISTIKTDGDISLVVVKESFVQFGLVDFQLSSGMMRVLYLLCFLEYIKHRDGNGMLLIDDLGEGLDYSRATLLGKKVFEVCEKQGLQLIASSNDQFMMNIVDLSRWQIIRRKKSRISVLNQANTPELFKRFRLTGLSNFDLFSSDFIDSFLSQL